jgi:hypothetical protein
MDFTIYVTESGEGASSSRILLFFLCFRVEHIFESLIVERFSNERWFFLRNGAEKKREMDTVFLYYESRRTLPLNDFFFRIVLSFGMYGKLLIYEGSGVSGLNELHAMNRSH